MAQSTLRSTVIAFASALAVSFLWQCSSGGTGDEYADDGGGGESAPKKLAAEYVVQGEDLCPEGIAFDPRTRSFLLSSLKKPLITRIGHDGKQETLVTIVPSEVTTVGIKVDSARRRLWACSRVLKQPTAEYSVLAFDLDTGRQTHSFPLDKALKGASCNDLAVDEGGTVYVTDSTNPHIYRVRPDETDAELFATHKKFEGGLPGLRLNGVAVTADGSYLLAGMFATGELFRVTIKTPTEVKQVTLTGSFSMPDGLALLDGKLYGVTTSRVHRVSFTGADLLAGTVRSIDLVSGLSTATVAEGSLYVVKSKVVACISGAKPKLPFKILRVGLDGFDK